MAERKQPPPADEPKPAGRRRPAGDQPTDPAEAAIQEVNEKTLPKTPDGRLVDPKQDEVRDTAG